MNTQTTWRRFAQLSGSDRVSVLGAAVVLIATWTALRVVGFRRWKNLLEHTLRDANPPASSDPALLAQAVHLTRLYSATARHLFLRTNCLERALALYFLLRRRGLPAELRFGARKQAAQLEAHAWVVCRGVALDEDQGEHRHFFPFDGVRALVETLPD